MVRRTRIQIANGEERDAIELDFEVHKEEWAEYKLLDGGQVRLKTSALKIFRILDVDGNLANDPNGDPFIMVRHNTQIVSTE